MGVVGLPTIRKQPHIERKEAGVKQGRGGEGRETQGEGGQKAGRHRWVWWACR